MKPLQRSDRAKYAAQVFYRDFNDLDIFIEDTAAETKKIYVNILGRVLGDAVSFTQIFPIGDKNRVYQRCEADQGVRARPAVYIVDGDHDELLGKPIPVLKRLYMLRRYCVENYLFDEDAAVSYLDDEVAEKSREDIAKSLDFVVWQAGISGNLTRHLRALIVAHRKACAAGLPRANIPLNELCGEADGSVNCDLIDVAVTNCKQRVDVKYGAGAFEAESVALKAHFECGDAAAMIKFISGKTILLPLLRRRMRSLFGISSNEALFRLRLSKHCDTSELEDIRDVIV